MQVGWHRLQKVRHLIGARSLNRSNSFQQAASNLIAIAEIGDYIAKNIHRNTFRNHVLLEQIDEHTSNQACHVDAALPVWQRVRDGPASFGDTCGNLVSVNLFFAGMFDELLANRGDVAITGMELVVLVALH